MVALIDKDDPYHASCTAALAKLSSEDFVTTWPCLTEAMYLLGSRYGYVGQAALWNYVVDGTITVYDPDKGEWERVRMLMQTYKDTPMDFADASLVVAGERLRLGRVFTTDSHFYAYRLFGRGAFEVVA
jgi:predicted nucleic acid-binding protein